MKKLALISTFDKSGVVEFAEELLALNYEILSTGGTARVLQQAGLQVTKISDFTGTNEVFGGRVKTLHPKIHGGLLMRTDDSSDLKEAAQNGYNSIEIVAVNLYPFVEVTSQPNCNFTDAIENIDIGGPTMLRAAAKNHRYVTTICDPNDYHRVIDQLRINGVTSQELRSELAIKVFDKIVSYDTAIYNYLTNINKQQTDKPSIRPHKSRWVPRYGENPHQKTNVFLEGNAFKENISLVEATQEHGQDMSYNNWLDADGALRSVLVLNELQKAAVSVIKHGNPCGLSCAETPLIALERAWQGDPMSAFGSVIACNRVVTKQFLQVLTLRPGTDARKGWFVEVLLAPSFEPEAIEYVRSKKSKTKMRLLSVARLDTASEAKGWQWKSILGGYLAQQEDHDVYPGVNFHKLLAEPFEVDFAGRPFLVGNMTGNKLSNCLQNAADFALRAVKVTHSNAIVIARDLEGLGTQVLGIGAGQPNRKVSSFLALQKAQENLALEYRMLHKQTMPGKEMDLNLLKSQWEEFIKLQEQRGLLNLSQEDYVVRQLNQYCAAASDAFFPFADGLLELSRGGVKTIVEPGGSMRDEEVIQAARDEGVSLIFCGLRHFRHG